MSHFKPPICRGLEQCRPIARVSTQVSKDKTPRFLLLYWNPKLEGPIAEKPYSQGEPEMDHSRGLRLLRQLPVKYPGPDLLPARSGELNFTS